MRQSNFERRYDPYMCKYVVEEIYNGTTYGEGMSDVLKSVGKRIFGRTGKKLAKKAASKAATATGEYAGRKGGEKIVELLSRNGTTVPPVIMEPTVPPVTVSASEPKKLTPDEINERVNMILSGGKLRRSKFI